MYYKITIGQSGRSVSSLLLAAAVACMKNRRLQTEGVVYITEERHLLKGAIADERCKLEKQTSEEDAQRGGKHVESTAPP